MTEFASDAPGPTLLYVITDLEIGGVPLHLLRLARVMRDRGYDLVVVSLAPAGPVGRMLEEEGFAVEDCGGRFGFDVRVIFRLARILRRRRPQIVHALLFHANVAVRLAARLARFPRNRVLCEIQTVEVERRWHLLVDRLTYRGCRLTIGNSPSVVDHLAKKARIPRSRLRLVRGGIDPAPYRRAEPVDRASLGLAEGDRPLIWVGRLDPVKGLKQLLAAVSALPSGLAVKLLLVGDGPLRATLTAHASALGVSDRVGFLGSRNDVPSLLATAEAFVFPSRTEGLPNALLEAMASGLPIVTTDVPGCRDLISDDRNGLVVPYDDVSALSDAIERVLTDTQLAYRLGNAAGVSAGDWHIKLTYDAYAETYDLLLTQQASRKRWVE